jgi:hypothetical protein
MNVQAVVDELKLKLPMVLTALEFTYQFVEENDPRLDQQLIIHWDQNLTIHDGLWSVVKAIKSNGFVITPLVLIGSNLVQCFISTKPLGTLPGDYH